MKKLHAISITLLMLFVPLMLQAQNWTEEQQEFLDHFKLIWDKIEETNEANHDTWKNIVNPQDDLTWWFTGQSMPYDLEAVKKWHQGWETLETKYTYTNIRPIDIKIIDNMAMIWFYVYGKWEDKNGKRNTWEDQRLEIFHKKDGKWFFVGGMVNEIKSFSGD